MGGVVAVALAMGIASVPTQDPVPTCGPTAAAAAGQVTIDPTAHAWRVFGEICHQASAGGRGVPDPTKLGVDDYDDDRAVVWETWAEFDFADRNSPAERAEPSRGEMSGKVAASASSTQQSRPRCSADDLVLESATGAERRVVSTIQIRISPPAHDFIRSQGFHRRTTYQVLFDTECHAADPQKIRACHGAQAIKARWHPLGDSADRSQYHWRLFNGHAYGLVALHVMSRDTPTWFWFTLSHTPTPDPQRRKSGEKPSKWHHYTLLGTQTGFVDRGGIPTQLRNERIEQNQFEVSCVTCHAYAGVERNGRPSTLPFERADLRGVPNPEFLWDSSACTDENAGRQRMKRLTTDFLWSLADNSVD